MHVPADLDETFTFDFLDREAAVADEAPVVRLDHPQAMTVLGIVVPGPSDPTRGVGPGARLVIRSAGVIPRGERRRQVVEIVVGHLAEAQSLCGPGKHSTNYPVELTGCRGGALAGLRCRWSRLGSKT